MPLDLSREVAIRWSNPDPRYVSLLREGGITAVLTPAPEDSFARACREAGIKTGSADEIQFLGMNEIARAAPGVTVALTAGLWPGVSRGPSAGSASDETASASRQPWVDANGYWIGYLRALYPGRAPVLGYLPNAEAGLGAERLAPFDTLELALIEAWVAGGNYILALEARYREALLRGEEKALAAWRQLGRTSAWLREHSTLFRQRSFPTVTALVEAGRGTVEIANLLYRHNASPALEPAGNPPAPAPDRRLALVAANLRAPDAQTRARILAHAEAGSAVITATPPALAWWQDPGLKHVRGEPDRDFFALGRGQVVAYKRPIADPSEFALDVIDIVTHKRRPVRLWNAPTIIALATSSPRAGEALLHAVNYGAPIDSEVLARIQGVFKHATLLRPDRAPLELKTAKRGATTEVTIPELTRLGVVVFG